MVRCRLLVALTASAACSPNLPLSEALVVRCGDSAQCPDGTVCIDGARCVAENIIDSEGPAMLSPDGDTVVRGNEPVLFVWQAVEGASLYVLTVALDAALTQPVPGFPLTLEMLSARVTLPEGTLFWSVTSDVTLLPTPAVGRRFGVISDSVYVRCEAGADCSPTADNELGTREVPISSIKRGIVAAQVYGATEVKVAARSDGSAYPDAVNLVDGISVSGAFDHDFQPAALHTAVVSPNAALNAAGITAPTRVSGFRFASTAGADRATSVIRISDSSSGLEVDDCDVSVTDAATAAVSVDGSADCLGPLMHEVNIVISNQQSIEIAEVNAIVARGGALRLSDSTVTVTTNDKNLAVRAVEASSSDLSFDGTSITMRCALQCYGIVVDNPRSLTISRTDIDVASSMLAGVYGIDSRDVMTEVSIDRSRITLAHGVALTGVQHVATTQAGRLRLTNSVIAADMAEFTYLIQLNGPAPVVVTNNTLVSGDVNSRAFWLRLESQHAVVVNNLFINAASSACSDAQPCATAISELNSGTVPGGFTAALFNNVFADFSAAHACALYSAGPTCLDTTINQTTRPNGATIAVGSNSLRSAAELGLLTDYRPQSVSLLVGAGHDTSANDCYATFASGPQPLQPPPPNCGAALVDRNGVVRPNPPSTGALEP